MASVYDVVINSYESNDGALAEAWAIAEHQGQEDLKKNMIKLYAALLVDDNESNVKGGYLTLQSGVRLWLIDERPANIPTSLWGAVWMVYMVLQLGRCHQGGNCLELQRTYSGGR